MPSVEALFRKVASRTGAWGWIGWALTPAALMYGITVRLRRVRLQGRGLHLGVPVLSVGNIEVGGTGKTPVTVWLARRIAGMGYGVAVVSRNTGRLREACRVRAEYIAPPSGIGDEALLLAESLRGKARVYTGRSKTSAAVKATSEEEPDIIIVDDGFQHMRLHRDIDLVVLDFEEPFGRGGLLPAGTLREPPSSLASADHIWVNRVKPGMSAEWVRRRIADFNWKAPVEFSRLRPEGLRLVGSGSHRDIPSGSVVAFCGVGRPESFRETLMDYGLSVSRLEAFPDHHEYSRRDLDLLRSIMAETGSQALVTTAKDAVKLSRLPGTGDILCMEVSLEVEGAVAELLADVEREIRKYRMLRGMETVR